MLALQINCLLFLFMKRETIISFEAGKNLGSKLRALENLNKQTMPENVIERENV